MRSAALAVVGLITFAVAPDFVYAQNRQVADRDGDGRISQREWSYTFQRFDRNGDGFLSEEELPSELRDEISNRMDRRRDDRRPGSGAGRLDQNRSGVVEGFEWPYNKDVFHSLDKDRNSVLSKDELNNINSATMIQLDRNNNQRIEADEWPGGFAQFDQLDNNKDGVVSSSEYFERGGEWQRRQRFGEWDKDRDGVVSSTEWRSRPDLFHKLDRSGDGKLSWEEFMASTERYDRPFGWDYDRQRRSGR